MLKGFMAKRKHSPKAAGGGPDRGRPPGRTKPSKGAAKVCTDWIYGIHAVAAAVTNPLRRRHRLVASRRLDADLEARLAGAEGGPALEVLDRQALEALLPPGAVHQGIALLADPLAPVSIADMCGDPADKAKADEAQQKFVLGIMEHANAIEEAAASIVKTEAASGHWLAANWRPITALVFVGLIVARWLGWTAPGMTEAEYLSVYDLLKICIGGYVVGRSAEKIVPMVATALKK